MLKNCWECVLGSRIDNEVYGTVLNGYPSSAVWTESQNEHEVMFRIPRPLTDGDKIEIIGKLKQNPETLTINLTTGFNSPDYENIPCQIEVSFIENTSFSRGIVKGERNYEERQEYEPILSIFPENKIKLTISVRETMNTYVDVEQSLVNLGSQHLVDYKLSNINFLTLKGDIEKIEQLNFKYG